MELFWKRNVFDKLCTYRKLDFLSKTVYLFKIDLALDNLQSLIYHKTK